MPGKQDVQEALSRVPLFSGCTRRERATIASVGKIVAHDEGEVLAREGQRGLGFFLILDGTADVSIGGRKRAVLGRGEFFGEISLLDDGPRTATVVATSPIQTFGLTAWAFKDVVGRHPSIALKLLETVAARLRAAASDVTA